jgi:hypothetical protein
VFLAGGVKGHLGWTGRPGAPLAHFGADAGNDKVQEGVDVLVSREVEVRGIDRLRENQAADFAALLHLSIEGPGSPLDDHDSLAEIACNRVTTPPKTLTLRSEVWRGIGFGPGPLTVPL